MKIVFDIETSGYDFDSLSESQKEYLLRFAEKESDEQLRAQKTDEAIRYLSLYPFTAKLVSIAMLNTQTENSMVLYEGEKDEWQSEEKNIIYRAMSEEEMLKVFWDYVNKIDQVITFNGRHFDIPFLMMRSAMFKIKPTRNFLKNRFSNKTHVDLLEQFTYYGTTRKFNLDFYCHAFGVESPKSKGISGMEVKELYNAGRIKDIAIYCGEDIRATYELYKIWRDYLNV